MGLSLFKDNAEFDSAYLRLHAVRCLPHDCSHRKLRFNVPVSGQIYNNLQAFLLGHQLIAGGIFCKYVRQRTKFSPFHLHVEWVERSLILKSLCIPVQLPKCKKITERKMSVADLN